MAGATIAAVDLVRAMDDAEHSFATMKKAAENADTSILVAIALPNSNECSKLRDLTLHRFAIEEKMQKVQNRFDEYSRRIKIFKSSVDSRTIDASIPRKLQKKKRKFSCVEEEEEEEETNIEEDKSGSETEGIRDFDGELVTKKSELKTTKQEFAVVEETLKYLKDAHSFCEKAVDLIKQVFFIRAERLKADFVEVAETIDVRTIEQICDLKRLFVGGYNLKFGIGKLVEGELLEYFCKEIRELSEGAIDVKDGKIYELSIDGEGLCRFGRLTRVEPSGEVNIPKVEVKPDGVADNS